jgi:hypothetical protein
MTTGTRKHNLRSIEAAAVAGIIHSVLLVIALLMLLRVPPITASQADISAFYQSPPSPLRGVLAFDLVVFAIIGFIWFVAVIRHRIGEQEPRFFATVFFGGGVLYAAMTLVGAASLAAPTVLQEIGGQVPEPGVAAITRSFGILVLAEAVPRVQALIVFSTAALGRLTRTLPTWLLWLSYLFGLGLLVIVTFFRPGVYAFPIWVAVVSLTILARPKGSARVRAQA